MLASRLKWNQTKNEMNTRLLGLLNNFTFLYDNQKSIRGTLFVMHDTCHMMYYIYNSYIALHTIYSIQQI